MSAEEFKLRKLIEDATFYISNVEEDETYHEKAKSCLDEADQIVLANTRESYIDLSSEVIVKLVECSLLSQKRDETAERVLQIFFQRITQEDQFYCQALLSQAQIEERKIAKKEYKGDQNLKQIKHAFSFVQRAIEISTKADTKAKYQFIVYNASIKTWHIIRSLMRPGWQKHLVEILEKVSNLLEEADDSDFNWRCRYLNALCKALMDAEKKPEALKILDKLIELTKKKGNCNFQEVLFRTRIHMYRDNNGTLANIKKDAETGEDVLGFKPLFVIQSIQSEITPAAAVEKELQLLLSTVAPAAVSDDPAAAAASAKLSPILQDRIAECGRMAIKHNLIIYAEGSCNVVQRARQGSLRAKIWCEYTKAELMLKKQAADVDKKTGMKLNTLQRQIEDFERRVEALKILDRAMIANKRLQDPDIIIEGCILIWNTGLPLLKKSARQHIYKPFQAAATALELIEANETYLRVCLHLELAKYEIEQDFLSKASVQLKKALLIDCSQVQKALGFELNDQDNPEDFQRPYDKTLKFLLKKLSLKTNIYGGDPESQHEQVILDVENAKATKNSKMRVMLLEKAVTVLSDIELPEFEVKPEQKLVEEEIVAAKRKFTLQQIRERKERVLVNSEISQLALKENQVQVAFNSATMCVAENWDHQKDADLIIAQSSAHIQLAKCYVEFLLEDDIEIGHKDLVTIEEDQDDREFTDQQKQTFIEQKEKFTQHIIKAVNLGQQVKQSWLVFNAAIEFWNNYLPIFKKPDFFQYVLPQGVKAMAECFEAMSNSFLSGNFSGLEPNKVDYELDRKMVVYSNLSMLLARIYEFQNQANEAVRICDTLLQKQLTSSLRKTFDSIRARITKQVSKLGDAQPKAPAGGKGAKGATPVEVKESSGPSKVDILTSEVLSFLELIQNGQKEMIQKALDALNLWLPNEQEEVELELNVELWCRLGRLAMNQNTNAQFKVALYCADAALKNGDQKSKQKQYNLIPVTRLRWYSVAEALYGEALYKLLDTQKQEKDSQDKLLHASVARFVESCNIASKANISYLLLESSKSLWNSLVGVLDSPNNRKLVIVPMTKVHSYFLACQESSDPDFLTLFYTAFFQVIAESKDWKLGEKIVDETFKYMPNTHHKVLWEAKMLFLSKLGKNVLSSISNMKESNASLMAKVWVRLARSSQQELEQHQAYNKAIEILRKEESIEVVEVLIEYSEWMHRKQYSAQDVEDQLMLAVDLLMDIEPGWDDEDEEIGLANQDDEAKTKKTGQSKNSRNSKALTKKSKGGKSMKQSQAGKTTKTKISKVSKASLRSKSMKSSGSRVSKKTTTSLSKRQEEDANPTFLNCSHYDKLIRIHSMLATLAEDATKQREYALDGHYFVMKMWEQSFQSLNAILFFESHVNECAELGFRANDQASRREYFSEVITSSDFQIPLKYYMPEKPEDWTQFEIPAELFKRAETHEDKVMIGKWTFMKPELTYYHLIKLTEILDSQYFHVQMLPMLKLMEIFSGCVLGQPILEASYLLQQSRLLMNLGQKSEAQKLLAIVDQKKILITEEEKKIQYEKIKALKDEQDNLVDDQIYFSKEEQSEPQVIETLRIHDAWLLYSEELLRWGDFVRAKDLAKEVSLHARILKDQDSYCRSLLILQKISYIEGDSAGSLRIAMLCQQYCKDISIVEQSIIQTATLLLEFEKFEDVKNLLNPAVTMLTDLRRQAITDRKGKGEQVANLPLEFALISCMGLQAISNYKKSVKVGQQESEEFLEQSFEWAKQFKNQMNVYGYREDHIVLVLGLCKIIVDETKNNEISDLKSIEIIQTKLTQAATLLLNVQEQVTNQVYFIGIHQDSAVANKLTLPLLRLLGVVKLRIAQVNTIIGVVKASLKYGQSSHIQDKKKLDKLVSNFMEAITKQIDAQSNSYKQNMNRYEKSISILYSAMNLIHQHCPEYAEALVEVAKNRRYLAVNKKHLRGQWRQDAIQVEEVNLKIIIEEGKDRKDALEEKGLDGEIKDEFVDYKKEMLQSFVDILTDQSGTELNQNQSTYDRVVQEFGTGNSNVLSTFAIEFAEGRANLNKEQAFFYIALYQYAISREQLLQTYMQSAPENHYDVRKRRAQQTLRQLFSYFTSPALCQNFRRIEQEQNEKSVPFQIMRDSFSIDQLKENLPGQTGYLVLQMSEDMSYLYVAYSQITKDRKFSYYTTKIVLNRDQRENLRSLMKRLQQAKINMQKTPITIKEDIEKLEQESEQEISSILNEIEKFFEPVTSELQAIIHPVKTLEQSESTQMQASNDAKNKAPANAAKAPAKPAPAAKGGAKAPAKGSPSEVAAYESVLPLTTSGVESIVILVDSRIEMLPLESLKIFEKVSVVSRDFNLHLHMHRVNAVGHKAELHNNTGIAKDELRYIIDIPDTPHAKQKADTFISKEMLTLMPGSQWDGIINHKHHIPSEGEWQKLICSSSLFVYYSMTCLLHKFPKALISDLTIFNKCKAMVIFDRMNSFKTLVDRSAMVSKHYAPDEQPMQQIALFTLCGVNSIVVNNWSTSPEANMEQLESLLRSSLTDGLYVGSAGLKKRKPESSLKIYQHNAVTYGVPLLRIQ